MATTREVLDVARDPKALLPAIAIVLGAIGAGSYMGVTIEPEEMTTLRVENATLKERTANLEGDIVELTTRVGLLEAVAESCQKLAEACEEVQ